MIASSLLATLLLALTVAAKPVVVNRSPVTLPLARRFNLASAHNLLRHDQARAQALKTRGSSKDNAARDVISSAVENRAVHYVASVGVGNPATQYDLIVDTGSSNTWVGANKAYVVTSTSQKTSDSVSVEDRSGSSFSGTEYTDQVAIAPGLVIRKQSIGIAETSAGYSNVDGVLGIGPVGLTKGTLSDKSATVPTVTDNLFTDGTIPAHEMSISFEPITDSSGVEVNGELTWGGTDPEKYTGSIGFAPITGTSPASEYWGIDQSISYGTTTILSTTAGIVDTGNTLILLATEAFNMYQSATGGVLDNATNLLRITSDQYSSLKSLFFTISGVNYELTPNAQIWPRNLNTMIGGTADNIYLIVSDLKSPRGQGLDFVLGFAFLERFYSVFDTANQRVGFATTPFTTATTN